MGRFIYEPHLTSRAAFEEFLVWYTERQFYATRYLCSFASSAVSSNPT